MLKKFLLSAEHLFDKKLKNGTVMVVIIWCCIVMTWVVNQTAYASNIQWNVIAAQSTQVEENIVIIWWKKYRVTLKEVK